MTFQFFAMEMIAKPRSNVRIIDQKEFKTAAKFIFDSLILAEDIFEILHLYIGHIRPASTFFCLLTEPSVNHLLPQ